MKLTANMADKRSTTMKRRLLLLRTIGFWIITMSLSITAQAQGNQVRDDGLPTTLSPHAQVHAPTSSQWALHYGWQKVDGINLFYREGGPVDAPTLVLLHGSPTSSIMYQSLMERLAATGKLHLIAMDYPSYGYSDAPDHRQYRYTFDHLAQTVANFLAARNIQRYALYMQDYGVPIGFRLIQAAPNSISAIIVQNGVIHLDGFPSAQDPDSKLRKYWRTRDLVSDAQFAEEAAQMPFPSSMNWTQGSNITPDNELLTIISQQRPGVVDAHNDLWFDYGSNLPFYPTWQNLLKSLDVPVEVIWGSHDKFFTVPGALAYLSDAPKAEIHILDAGHFATLEDPDAIAILVSEFMSRHDLR
jgi:pimeloyl-ACP methyl ester carboxylesterase